MSGNMSTVSLAASLEITTTPLIALDPEPDRYNFRYFGMSVGFWTVFVGSIGNMLTILTYIANVKMRTTFNLLLFNLAIVDFCTSTLMIPFNIAGYMQLQWPFGNQSYTARLQAFSYFCCGYSSIVFLVVITVNRFIGAIFPGKYKSLFSQRRMVWVLLICYLFAPAFLLPFLLGSHKECVSPTNPAGSLTGYNTRQFLCTFICLKEGWSNYMEFTRILFQFIPLIAMIIMYTIIFVYVRNKRENLGARMTPTWSSDKTSLSAKNNDKKNSTSETQKLGSKRSRSMSMQVKRRRKEDSRMLVISVVICVGFTVTFLPSVIVNLIKPRPSDIYHMAASNLSWFNSSLNPIIYVILNRRFRKEYWRIIRLIFGVIQEKFVHESNSTHTVQAASTTSNSNLNNNLRRLN